MPVNILVVDSPRRDRVSAGSVMVLTQQVAVQAWVLVRAAWVSRAASPHRERWLLALALARRAQRALV